MSKKKKLKKLISDMIPQLECFWSNGGKCSRWDKCPAIHEDYNDTCIFEEEAKALGVKLLNDATR